MSAPPARLRVAACQILTVPSPEASAARVVRWIERAAAEGVEVVAFPEAALSATPRTRSTGRPPIRPPSPPPRPPSSAPPPATAWPSSWARRAGRTAPACGDRPFNSLLLIDRDGTVRGRYAKTHLAERWPAPGRRLPLVTLAGVPSCFIICHDVRYPELVRLPAIAGARICYFCSNESGLLQEYKLSAYRAMPIARATENSIFLVMANAPGNPDDLHSPSQSHGNSKIVHPDGNVLDEAGFFEERLVAATIDLAAADRAVARRAVEDETVLRAWLEEGARLVEVDAPAAAAGGRRQVESSDCHVTEGDEGRQRATEGDGGRRGRPELSADDATGHPPLPLSRRHGSLRGVGQSWAELGRVGDQQRPPGPSGRRGELRIREIKTYTPRVPATGGRHQLMVKVETDEGLYGWGESGLTSRELAVLGAIKHFSELLIGRDPLHTGTIWQELYRSNYFEGGRVLTAAISAIDIALHDLKGKALNVPVYQLLGGRQRDHVPLFATTSARTLPELLDQAKLLLDGGLAGDPHRDVAGPAGRAYGRRRAHLRAARVGRHHRRLSVPAA